MEIKLLVFGSLIDILGDSSIEMKFDELNSNHDTTNKVQYDTHYLIKFLKTRYPKLSNMKFVMSVDRKICHENTLIQPHSEIAILPPFSGG